MANEEFTDPRLAEIYDELDGDRADLHLYLDIADRLGASRVLDIGCGTGALAVLLAERGLDVVGVDPAAASLDVARVKPGGERVTWLLGSADVFRGSDRDLVVMTGNTAQQFTGDQQWRDLLARAHAALVPRGHLVFETRTPGAKAWETWTGPRTRRTVDLEGVGAVETWTEVLASQLPLVRFRSSWTFEPDGETLTSVSTIRFRSEAEVRADLGAAGFTVIDLLDAPDRPGLELVFIAERPAVD
ncbi:class I SAM-dependent methyltransferase [uncultured Amnibacterium sp.]|uniref:class I SAM-dependent methyltransferase n=1 Tax=uncultured Amnibacterium sp. TaxID=1631851 RepID=UPI0035CC77D3